MGKFERRLGRRQKPMRRRVLEASVENPRSEGFESPAWKGLVRLVAQHDLPKELRQDYVARSSCGHCGLEMDEATHHSGSKPAPGELAVCWSCAGVNRFGPELGLEKVTDEEVEGLDPELYELDLLHEARALIRAAMMGSAKRGGEA